MEIVELGVDGNCAFALLGENLQSGEAEFVEIKSKDPIGSGEYRRAAEGAAIEAYKRLKGRLDIKTLPFFFGASHPSC